MGAERKRYREVIIVLALAIFMGTFYFGLRPRDYNFTNGVDWVVDQSGITFTKYGIAYTNSFAELIGSDAPGKSEFSIEIGLKPLRDKHEEGFRFVLSLHNGKDREQLLIGQWRSWIVIMNGDDYDHKRRTKRITVDTSSKAPRQRLLTITTGENGTKVYFDNRLAKAREDFILKIPQGPETRLLLGNSVYGRHSWKGDIYGLAFYKNALSARDIANHAVQWSHSKSFAFAEKANPLALYLFNERQGSQVQDYSDGRNHLYIPARMKILMKEILSSTANNVQVDKHFLADVILNLVGFMPLGFIVAVVFFHLGGAFKKNFFVMSIVFCLLASLTIEFAQAWLPSRSSQMPDLMLNTVGGLCGVTIFWGVMWTRGGRKWN
jgi:VanZ family protein